MENSDPKINPPVVAQEQVSLSEIERQRIRLEERYRHDVQKELQPPSSNPIASFLNSNFGIWLLSAIFISGAGSMFAKWQSANEEREKAREVAVAAATKTRETIERLDLEIGYRFSQVQIRLNSIFKMKSGERHLLPPELVALSGRDLVDKLEEHCRIQTQWLLDNMAKPPGTDFQSLYPEYVGFSLPALVAELKRHVADKATQLDLNLTLSDLTGLNVFLEVRKASLSQPDNVARAFIGGSEGHRALILPRWKESHWYFLDGTRQNPFL